MARSKSHQLGEFIGAFFEDLMKKPIREFAERNGLYFDTSGPRKARGGRYISFDKLVQAFSVHGLDIYFDENSKESDVRKK